MQLQKLVDRDAAALEPGLEELEAVIGFDGADNFCHVTLRLVSYKEEMKKESELKGIGLAVAIGDDHNHNLTLIVPPRMDSLSNINYAKHFLGR